MKKIMFSALACVAFAGSAFASNDVVENSTYPNNEFLVVMADKSELNLLEEEFAPCQVEFWVFDSEGGFVDYVHKLVDVGTASDCNSYAMGLIDGYTLAYPDRVISNVEIMF